jgi:hypothetical protein
LYNLTDARPYNSFSYPVFEQFRQRNRAFSGIFAVVARHDAITANEDADQFENVQVSRVSAGYFSVLGVEAVIGRTIQGMTNSPAIRQPSSIVTGFGREDLLAIRK